MGDVWVPMLPKTSDYVNDDRRRFMQHGFFVLTKSPGERQVQITVEGRCRCGGQRQTLVCGPLQMDLTERERDRERRSRPRGASNGALPASRRLELPFSSHVFLAAMGQVCTLPEDIRPPPLSGESALLRPPEGSAQLSHDALRQWSRKEIEEELRAEVVTCVGCAACFIMIVVGCLYVCLAHMDFSGPSGGLYFEPSTEGGTWLSTFHRAFERACSTIAAEGSGEVPASRISWIFSLLRAIWFLITMIFLPLFWVLDLLLSLPHVPSNQRGDFSIPNPMVVAISVSLLVAAFSAPFGWSDLFGRVRSGLERLRAAWCRDERDASKSDKGREGKHTPACFLCLDRPSRYAVEPCGHRVTCAECTIQLVEAAVRNRSEGCPEKGGTCPFCGTAVSRAIRVF